MAKSPSLPFFMISAVATILLAASMVVAGGDSLMATGWVTGPHCKGSIAECLEGEEGEEFELDSEINRRILADTRYISYGALRKNTVPCSRRGASYYNCRPGAQANPYNRGCSAIARCRGG
ncbi:protein RALF-like 33 [Lotus japonicus]|uniref:protein RALF-like 33 n=1 Tax=Lotus japonicus TaxID=34305 RepID=UPI002587A463|nr:protein RALF-like 33 [Lotus japonicus]